MKVHLIDGTYELFRQHFGMPEDVRAEREHGAVRGVLENTLALLEAGATHVGVASDHVVESFRNDLWPSYKSSEGMDPAVVAQFGPLERALGLLGVHVWAMVELEADDALASAAQVAAADAAVEQVLLLTPDKDLAQCVVGERVVQWDRRHDRVVGEAGVIEKFGVPPESIPDLLALMGDSADGFPGLPGWGQRSAATLLARYLHIADIPRDEAEWDVTVRGAARLALALRENEANAELFLTLATLRRDPRLLADVDQLRWRGPEPGLQALANSLGAEHLFTRARALAGHR